MDLKTNASRVKSPADGVSEPLTNHSPDGSSFASVADHRAAVPSRRRVFAYRLLLLGFGFFSLVGWMRCIASLVSWYWLNYAGVQPGVLYLVISGFLWGIAGLTAVIWLWLRRRWVSLAGMAVALFLALTYWIDYALTARFQANGNNLPFALLLTLLGLAFVFLVLHPLDEVRQWVALRQRSAAIRRK